MSDPNPYSAPSARVADPAGHDDPELERVASGQRIVIVSLIVSFAAGAMQASSANTALFVSIGASVLAIYGIVRLSTGLGIHVVVRVVLAALMFVPLANLITMLILSLRATSMLRAAGYTVGLLGAKKPV